ncbi:transporter substrate-binding domain-containing protein [Sinirhodobacter populi]|uniref:Transporter substrate-binding domain-containing protein n=1 Tax=Paenirhodobacter populi TaxID=2306993 RepID=A0A443KNQ5_9RHOB|nr:transporter substrate-binding domain-containing protein [Sinirhodobacter populi]RWR34491.1 transporter substrate-binding domain-containing protein [Sinirhodobacter populi]
MHSKLLTGLAAAAMLFGATLSAQAQDALARAKAAGVLKVGTETAFAPFDFIDAGTHAGLNVDVFDEIGKELGVKIEWITLDWAGVLPGLEAGHFDMVAGPATITAARIEKYRFTTPIAESTVAILKSAKDTEITKPEDIAGKAVGAGHSSSQLDQLKAFSATLPSPVDVREYTSNNEAYADLAAGRIVGVANSFPNIAYVAQQRPNVFAVVEPPFGEKTYFGYPGLKDADHASLMDAIDEALMKMKGDGRLDALQMKWFGVTFETPDAVTDPSI